MYGTQPTRLVKALLAVILLGAGGGRAAYAAEAGQPAPAFSATLFSGKKVNNATYKGQVLLINFWASYCGPCRTELPAIAKYYAQHKQQGFRVLTLSMDARSDLPAAQKIISAYPFDNGWKRNADFFAFPRIWGTPLSFLIDRKGNLAKSQWHADSDAGITLAMLDKAITPLLAKQTGAAKQAQ